MTLEALIRDPLIVKAAGEDLAITQIRTKHIPGVIRLCAPIFGPLAALAKGDKDTDIANLVVEHADTVISLVAIGTGKTEEWVGELEIDELIEVGVAVIEVNASFFAKRVLPLITEKMARAGNLAKPGQTASNS